MHVHQRQPVIPRPATWTEANLYRIGQESPDYEEWWRMQHGRYLNGFGDFDPQADPGAAAGLYEDEAQDDTVGSGIFDEPGRTTVHAEMGVFEDHPSLPGFIARSVPFQVNPEILESNGAAVVEVPGGGLFYVEREGRLAPYDAPPRRPYANPYATYTSDQPIDPYGRTFQIRDVPERDASATFAPTIQSPRPRPAQAPVLAQRPASSSMRTTPLRGYGAEPPPAPPPPASAGVGKYLVGGALAGIGLALVMHAAKKRGT